MMPSWDLISAATITSEMIWPVFRTSSGERRVHCPRFFSSLFDRLETLMFDKVGKHLCQPLCAGVGNLHTHLMNVVECPLLSGRHRHHRS